MRSVWTQRSWSHKCDGVKDKQHLGGWWPLGWFCAEIPGTGQRYLTHEEFSNMKQEGERRLRISNAGECDSFTILFKTHMLLLAKLVITK